MYGKIRDKRLYSCCFVGCCFQDLFKTAVNKPVKSSSCSFSSMLKFKWRNYAIELTWLQLGRIPVLFFREIRIPYGHWFNRNSPCFTYAHVDITFSRWDMATEVHELVTEFQTFAFNKERLPSTLFNVSSYRDQRLLLPAPGYAGGIWLEQVYWQDVWDYWPTE